METRTVDNVVRIYKNSSDRVIGIHCIEIYESREADKTPGLQDVGSMDDRRKRQLKMNVSFTRYNLQMGEDRTVVSIQMIGKYDDFVMNGTNDDIIEIVYNSDPPRIQNKVWLNEFPTIGDLL